MNFSVDSLPKLNAIEKFVGNFGCYEDVLRRSFQAKWQSKKYMKKVT